MHVRTCDEKVSRRLRSSFLIDRWSLIRCRPLSSYYKVQETEKDYICALSKDSGMHSCSSLPRMKYENQMCNDSATPGAAHLSGFFYNGSCINWNQYYTNCKAGEKNPFQGAISFDTLGLAWVAIFLVSTLVPLANIFTNQAKRDKQKSGDLMYIVQQRSVY